MIFLHCCLKSREFDGIAIDLTHVVENSVQNLKLFNGDGIVSHQVQSRMMFLNLFREIFPCLLKIVPALDGITYPADNRNGAYYPKSNNTLDKKPVLSSCLVFSQ